MSFNLIKGELCDERESKKFYLELLVFAGVQMEGDEINEFYRFDGRVGTDSLIKCLGV